jgi:type VI secretion system protein ImpI
MQLLLTLRNADTFGVAEATKRVSSSLSIGRGKQAGWPLPDPTRMLSAVHCEIRQEKRGFILTDFSRNGTRLNGEAVTRMVPEAIGIGDQIEIGPYVIFVGTDDRHGRNSEQNTLISKRANNPVSGDKTVIAPSLAAATPPTASEILPRNSKKPPQSPTRKPQPVLYAEAESRRFVAAFCEGASLDPDNMAGRSDFELARELGLIMRNVVSGINEISLVTGELRTVIGSGQRGAAKHIEDGQQSSSTTQKRKQAERLLSLYFGDHRPEGVSSDEAIGAAIDDALHHNKALFYAMQTALFRLLNELSPSTIERDTSTGLLRSKSAKNWQAYIHRWEILNSSGEDGMLDVFLRYFGEAYDNKMENM